ncbi:MAG: hypothetical protein FWB85_05085 [Chitinispirillia bacterium]|nr:hypothetical protein [Chitinispirillia bacterium]
MPNISVTKKIKAVTSIIILITLFAACGRKNEAQQQNSAQIPVTEALVLPHVIPETDEPKETDKPKETDEVEDSVLDADKTLVMSGRTLIEYTRGKTNEVWISVLLASQSFLEKYETYNSFIKDELYAQKIAFIPDAPVKDFRWLSVAIEYDSDNKEIYELYEVYRLDELHPQKPLVVSWVEVGIMSRFGFSYCDNGGQIKYFIGRVGNYGIDPDEYDGPDYVIYQLFP